MSDARDRALVLGATGFVGTHVCRALQNAGYDVHGVARRRPDTLPSHTLASHDVGSSYEFSEMDIGTATPEVIRDLVDSSSPTVVINTIGSIWGRSDAEMHSAATRPVEVLLEGLTTANHRPWLVHLGSVLEYGTIGHGATASADRDAARPTSAYGIAKLAATQAVLAAVEDGRVDAVVLRIANVAGPGTPAVSLLGQVAKQLLDAKNDGTSAVITLDALVAHRDYVDVRDVADAVVAAAGVRTSGTVLDIGKGESTAVRDLVRILLDTSGVDVELVERAPKVDAGRPQWTQVDIGPARDHLDWTPRRTITESVEDFWAHTTA